MKKFMMVAAFSVAAMLPTAAAQAATVTVADPTLGTANLFSGTGSGEQTGYVSVGSKGVVVCNGGPNLAATPLENGGKGFIWVGAENAAEVPDASHPGAPENVVGDGHQKGNEADKYAPCPNPSPATGLA